MTYPQMATVCRHVHRAMRLHMGEARVRPNAVLNGLRSLSSSPHPSESFLTTTNNVYVEKMYTSWKEDPKRFVHAHF